MTETKIFERNSAWNQNTAINNTDGISENILSDSNGSNSLELKTYKRRWWILLTFCIASIAQGTLWNTWSPLLDAVLIAYQWTDSFVTLLHAVSDLGYIICAFPLMYVVETTDLRNGLIIAVSLMVFCSSGWLIALVTGQTWLIAIGGAMNGIGACITKAAVALLSVTWFPTSERTKATAIATVSGSMGTGLGFLTGPYISGANVTADEVNNRGQLSADFVQNLKNGILNVIYFDTGLGILGFIMVVAYFPPKPPSPPSRSQAKERKDFWQGIKHLFSNPQFWILNIAFNLPNGTFNAWLPLCSINFRSLGVDETTAGWIGFTSLITSAVGSVGMSAVVDRMKRRMKLVCLALGIIALVLLIMLACIQEHYIHIPKENVTAVLYALCISAALCINGVVPLFFELGCELAFPVHEGLTCSFLTVSNNMFGMLFFLLFQIPSLAADTQWMTWTCLGTCALTPPLLLIMKERYHRLDTEVNASIQE